MTAEAGHVQQLLRRVAALGRADAVVPLVWQWLRGAEAAPSDVGMGRGDSRQTSAIVAAALRTLGSASRVPAHTVDDALALVRNTLGPPTALPAEVVLATAVMLLKHQRPADARDWLEAWLAESPEVDATPYVQYEQMIELYAVHTLGALHDYAVAQEMLLANDALSPHAKQKLLAVLKKLETFSSSSTPAPASSYSSPSKRVSFGATTVREFSSDMPPSPPSPSSATADFATRSVTPPSEVPTAPSASPLARLLATIPSASSVAPPAPPVAPVITSNEPSPPLFTKRLGRMASVLRPPQRSSRQNHIMELLPGLVLALSIALTFWYRRRLAESSLWRKVIAPMLGLVTETAQMGFNVRY